jgi:hypothetical protein
MIVYIILNKLIDQKFWLKLFALQNIQKLFIQVLLLLFIFLFTRIIL